MDKKNIVVLTGAGISAESGIKTFRDSGGLWEEYDIMEVASIQGWYANPALVLDFYNKRRRQLQNCEPNFAHKGLAILEEKHHVTIITQNVDNLHERGGSSNIIHLHGELTKARCTEEEEQIYDIGYNDINIGDKCPNGHQLRPHIVWFGEPVPLIIKAAEIVKDAEIFIIIGTSLNVYPAAGLVDYVSKNTPIYLIDPNEPNLLYTKNITHIKEKASTGVEKILKILM